MENEFDPNEISEELLSLAGIFNILRNDNEGQEMILHFKNGQKVSGTKVMFDENLGIVGIKETYTFTRESAMAEKPIEEKVICYSRYAMTQIYGISTFPKINK